MRTSLPLLKFRKKIFISLGIFWLSFSFFAANSFLSLILLSGLALSSIATVYFFTRPIEEAIRALLHSGAMTGSQWKGEWPQLVELFRALSEKIERQVESFTNQREEILESISEGIIATDTSANVTFINDAACKILGVEQSALLKQNLNEIKEALPQKCHELILQALQTAEISTQPWVLESDLHLHLISMPLVHNSGALLVLQDKTSDYKIIEMGKAFIANASHELRTPITIIRGFAETLQDHLNLSKETLQQIADKIVQTCGRLDKLVRSLLTLADIENRSEDQLKKTDLSLVLENCKHLFSVAHPKANLQIKEPPVPTLVTADVDLLELAILNVLENAVKYSKTSPKIQVWVESLEKEIEIHIKDSGIGISEKDLSQIFDRFYTVDKARSRKSGGAGLGLSIVKTVLEKHKGKVRAVSTLGSGSQFTLSLPKSLS